MVSAGEEAGRGGLGRKGLSFISTYFAQPVRSVIHLPATRLAGPWMLMANAAHSATVVVAAARPALPSLAVHSRESAALVTPSTLTDSRVAH